MRCVREPYMVGYTNIYIENYKDGGSTLPSFLHIFLCFMITRKCHNCKIYSMFYNEIDTGKTLSLSLSLSLSLYLSSVLFLRYSTYLHTIHIGTPSLTQSPMDRYTYITRKLIALPYSELFGTLCHKQFFANS